MSENRLQEFFNPIDYGFTFTSDGWYSFDRKDASRKALTDRNARSKELTKAGWKVRRWSQFNQLISKGGAGSGRPHIEEIVTVYGLDANRQGESS